MSTADSPVLQGGSPLKKVAAALLSTPSGGHQGRKPSLQLALVLAAAGIVLLSVVRALTGAQDITSTGQVASALELAVPIGLAGLGGLWAERAGVVNIGLEGMMILGTWFGAWAGYQWGPWTGALVGIAGGAIGGLVHAIATVTFGVDHIVSGVALNILAGGATQYLSKTAFGDLPGGSSTQSPPVDAIGRITVPGLSGWLETLNAKHWLIVSDAAGLAGGVVTDISLLTIVALALVPASFWVLWRTPFGLRLRSCGEAPVAAETLGVNVYRYKYLAVVISGALAGLGGAYLVEVASSYYREGQTAGRGYIGLAAMIFGNWRPGGLAAGAGLFGYTDSLKLRSGGESVHALLLAVAIALMLPALWNVYRRRYLPAATGLACSGALLIWVILSDEVPGEFVDMAPYVTTLLVLALASQRLRMPAAAGIPYRRGVGA